LESDARGRARASDRTELEKVAHEVSPDDVLERQIRDDAEREPDENLLEGPKNNR
jgi:hypothetical protein